MDWKWSLMTLLMIDTITLEQMSKWNSIIAFKMDCLVLLSKSIKVVCKNKTVGCFFSLLFLKCKTLCAMGVTHLPAKGSRKNKFCEWKKCAWWVWTEENRQKNKEIMHIKINKWKQKQTQILTTQRQKCNKSRER